MDRTVLLEEPEISVAGDELRIADSHHRLGEIRGADLHREPAAASGPILMIVVGLICLLSATGDVGVMGAVLGAGLIAAAAIWWTQKKPSFQVILSKEGGEEIPFESLDEQEAARVLEAIQRARSLPGPGGGA